MSVHLPLLMRNTAEESQTPRLLFGTVTPTTHPFQRMRLNAQHAATTGTGTTLLTPAFAVSAGILTTLAWTTDARLANAICPLDIEIILTTPMAHSNAEEPFVKKEAIKLHVCENLEFISNHLNMKETMNVFFVLLNFQTVKVIQATRIMMMSL